MSGPRGIISTDKSAPRCANSRGHDPRSKPLSRPKVTEATVALFHGKYVVEDAGFDSPCWMWRGNRDRDGYARFAAGEKRGFSRAHQFAYEVLVGPVKGGLHLDHLCRNRRCVNPSHLEPVSVRENLMRGETYAASAAAKTHCKYGHPLSGENLYVPPGSGTRKCRECVRRRKREWRARQRDAA
jgi:hypothetical protein